MLANLLRDLRGPKTVEEAADGAGVSRSALYLWESTGALSPHTGRPTHRRVPDPAYLEVLLAYYGASPEDAARARELLGAEKLRAKMEREARGAQNAPSLSEDDIDTLTESVTGA